MTYSDYKILCAPSIEKLEPMVNDYLKIGYIPVGGIAVDNSGWHQAVAKVTFGILHGKPI